MLHEYEISDTYTNQMTILNINVPLQNSYFECNIDTS